MEEHPRNGQSRNTSVPRINEEYITQVSEEIEGRITKNLSQEFNRIESRISDALSKLDEFLSNQQIQTHSKTVPGTFRNTNVENQGTNEDDSQSDPHPEAGIFRGQTTQNSGPKDCRDNNNQTYCSTESLQDQVFVDPNANTQQNPLQMPDSSYTEIYTEREQNLTVELQKQCCEVFSLERAHAEIEHLRLQNQIIIEDASQLLRKQELEHNRLIEQLNQPDTDFQDDFNTLGEFKKIFTT